MISVIIPTYNRKHVLPRAITSVQNQTVSDTEIIVIDDCSIDGTADLLREYVAKDPRITFERFSENQGVAAARNRGIERARGEWIVLLDSDDELLPEALQTFKDMSVAHPDAGVFCTRCKVDDGTFSGFSYTSSTYVSFDKYICNQNVLPQKQMVFFIKKAVIADTRFIVPYVDFIFYRRVAKNTKVFFIATPLARYHFDKHDKGSVTTRRKKQNKHSLIKRTYALISYLNEFDAYFDQCPTERGPLTYGIATGLLLEGKRKIARKYARQAVQSQYGNTRYRIFYTLTFVPGAKLWFSIFLRFK